MLIFVQEQTPEFILLFIYKKWENVVSYIGY